jgi:hypothetical protein
MVSWNLFASQLGSIVLHVKVLIEYLHRVQPVLYFLERSFSRQPTCSSLNRKYEADDADHQAVKDLTTPTESCRAVRAQIHDGAHIFEVFVGRFVHTEFVLYCTRARTR